MSYNKIPSGINIPNDIYVIIEIPYGHSLIKYEIDKKYDNIFVDRFIETPVFYPFNYGYINKTLCKDGDNLDVIVINTSSIITGSIINCRPIGGLNMVDESGIDNKIIAVPNYNISNEYNNINDICDISKNTLDKIYYFFENYKSLNLKKWVEIGKWFNIDKSKYLIEKSINYFNKKKN